MKVSLLPTGDFRTSVEAFKTSETMQMASLFDELQGI